MAFACGCSYLTIYGLLLTQVSKTYSNCRVVEKLRVECHHVDCLSIRHMTRSAVLFRNVSLQRFHSVPGDACVYFVALHTSTTKHNRLKIRISLLETYDPVALRLV